ncbi:unnamed protein product [Ixodes pacificus]
MIWSRIYATNVDHSHALRLAKHRTHTELQTLLWLGYCRHSSEWTRAITQMLVELLIIMSPKCVLMQCSGPIYEPRSNIVIRGTVIPSYIIKFCKREIKRKRSLLSLKLHCNKGVSWSVALRVSIISLHSSASKLVKSEKLLKGTSLHRPFKNVFSMLA